MSVLLDVLSVLLVCAGLAFLAAGTAGLLRFPDALTRLHALTKADGLGLGLIVLGLLPQCPDIATALKLLVVWLILLFSSVAMGQLVGAVLQREEASR